MQREALDELIERIDIAKGAVAHIRDAQAEAENREIGLGPLHEAVWHLEREAARVQALQAHPRHPREVAPT